jgi:hypothetical protein
LTRCQQAGSKDHCSFDHPAGNSGGPAGARTPYAMLINMNKKWPSVIFFLITSSLFGQDNPMFDSLEYFRRNKITRVHYYMSSWYYSTGFKYLRFSFDKNTNTLSNDSLVFHDPSLNRAKKITTLGTHDFSLKDTVYRREGFSYSSTIKYQFDGYGRLIRILDITDHYNVRAVDDAATSIFDVSPSEKTYTTTTEYFYADSKSKRIKLMTTESPYYREERNFFYKDNRLVKRVDRKTQKGNRDVSVDTFLYEYYVDGKLMKETRKVKDSRCKSHCEGTIEYKYDTD